MNEQMVANAYKLARIILDGKSVISTDFGIKNENGLAAMLIEFAENNGPKLTEQEAKILADSENWTTSANTKLLVDIIRRLTKGTI